MKISYARNERPPLNALFSRKNLAKGNKDTAVLNLCKYLEIDC